MYQTFRNLKDEVWKPIPHLPGYEISNRGRVKSTKNSGGGTNSPARLRILETRKDGVKRVTVSVNGVRSTLIVPFVVLETFGSPQPAELSVVGFRDGNRSNSNFENLFWTVRRQVKLSYSDAERIREIYATYTTKMKDIAKMFGVTNRTIADIVNFRTWRKNPAKDA